jgi:hypothetical protein
MCEWSCFHYLLLCSEKEILASGIHNRGMCRLLKSALAQDLQTLLFQPLHSMQQRIASEAFRHQRKVQEGVQGVFLLQYL